MKEMVKVLRTWQSERGKLVGSVLYSDIDKSYYAALGWQSNLTNTHITFPPAKSDERYAVQRILENDLKELCRKDELMTDGPWQCQQMRRNA